MLCCEDGCWLVRFVFVAALNAEHNHHDTSKFKRV